MSGGKNGNKTMGRLVICFFLNKIRAQRYIFLNYSLRGGGGLIKPVHIEDPGEENWYIRIFFHIFTQKRVNFKFLGKF